MESRLITSKIAGAARPGSNFKPDISSAAFGTIRVYSAGVALVEAEVVRVGWDGYGNLYINYGTYSTYGWWVL
jgi:hypothetical protein